MAFLKATIYHLGTINLDHAPLLVDTNPVECFCPHPFRFETIWVRDPHCGGVIRRAWDSVVVGSQAFILCHKQMLTTKALKRWNREVFGYYNTMIKDLSNIISEAQSQDRTESNTRMEANLQGELNEWLRRNEALWRQK